MVVGKFVNRLRCELKDKLRAESCLGAVRFRRISHACRRIHGRSRAHFAPAPAIEEPPGIFWDDEKYQGDAYGAYSWAVHVAEVSVDTLTGEVQVDDFTALQEVGRVLNPVLAAGQIEGGVAQAIGFALYEKVVWSDGAMTNNQMTNYIMPTSVDIPRIRVFFEEIPYAHGAMGAKGIGELPMDGPAPAVVNAIENAAGHIVHHVPLMPEDILSKLTDEPVGLMFAAELQNAGKSAA